MQRRTGCPEQLATVEEVQPVVGVPTVGRASAGGNEAGVAQLSQVVGDEVLGLSEQLRQLTYPPIAAGQLRKQLPALAISDELEEFLG